MHYMAALVADILVANKRVELAGKPAGIRVAPDTRPGAVADTRPVTVADTRPGAVVDTLAVAE